MDSKEDSKVKQCASPLEAMMIQSFVNTLTYYCFQYVTKDLTREEKLELVTRMLDSWKKEISGKTRSQVEELMAAKNSAMFKFMGSVLPDEEDLIVKNQTALGNASKFIKFWLLQE